MSVTLLTSHWQMFWLKADAEENMNLYADTSTRRKEEREEGHSVRSQHTALVWGSGSEWVMC